MPQFQDQLAEVALANMLVQGLITQEAVAAVFRSTTAGLKAEAA